MKWNELSYWLRGGIIALAVFLIISIVFFIVIIFGRDRFDGDFAFIFGILWVGFLLMYAPLSFGIGALVGWIIGKIKSKKK